MEFTEARFPVQWNPYHLGKNHFTNQSDLFALAAQNPTMCWVSGHGPWLMLIIPTFVPVKISQDTYLRVLAVLAPCEPHQGINDVENPWFPSEIIYNWWAFHMILLIFCLTTMKPFARMFVVADPPPTFALFILSRSCCNL